MTSLIDITTGVDSTYLSETSVGQSWLSQFDVSDRDTARLILDSVLYVTNAQLVSGLRDLIIGFVKSHASGPVAIFAARENTGEAYWRRHNLRPLSVSGRSPVGSEGILSHLCRDLASSSDCLLSHPSIEEMRNARCRHIVCLDDMIGSGNRITSFAEWLYKNKTIRSWHSLRYIQFVACAYAASVIGEKHISMHKLYTSVQLSQSVGFGRSIWTQAQRAAIEDLCISYAQYTRKPNWPVGFGNAFTTIVFAHKCPNTNPAILWASKRNSWSGIFPIRPEFLLSGVRSRVRRRQERILKALGHTRLGKPSFFSKLNDESRQLVVTLSCIAGQRRRDTVLSDILEVSLPMVRKYIAQCQLYGWIDSERRLTQLGKNALSAARRNDCIPSDDVACESELYYPQTLRSSASSSSSGLRKGECLEN